MVDVASFTSYDAPLPASPLPGGGRHPVERLSEWLEQFDRPRPWGESRRITSGCEALDRILPEQGFRSGSLVEWMGDGPGSGVSLLALRTAQGLQAEGGTIVVVDRQQRFYAPAAAAAGVNLPRTIVVRPTTDQDELWAIDQALRCPHVGGVVAWPERIDSYTFRRLQLAAEESGTLGLLVRPLSAEREPTWADVRLKVSPRASRGAWRWNVRLLRARGRFGAGEVELELAGTEVKGFEPAGPSPHAEAWARSG